ncbi:MAG: hypothetical protein ACSLEX_00800, partial [Minisyncoccota bacterium]
MKNKYKIFAVFLCALVLIPPFFLFWATLRGWQVNHGLPWFPQSQETQSDNDTNSTPQRFIKGLTSQELASHPEDERTDVPTQDALIAKPLKVLSKLVFHHTDDETWRSGDLRISGLTGKLRLTGEAVDSQAIKDGSVNSVDLASALTVKNLTVQELFTAEGVNGLSISAGAISATGITSSGTITFSGFTSNGGPLYTNASGVLAQVTAGTSTQVLHGGTTPTFGAVSLTTDISGILPV